MKVDLSKFADNSLNIPLMKQLSEELIIETYGNWETLFVKCEFLLVKDNRWIPTLYRIGIRPKINNLKDEKMDIE